MLLAGAMTTLAEPVAFPTPPIAPRGNRDREAVHFVGRHGLVRIEHAMAAMGAGRTVTYGRVAACVQAGLLERVELLRCEPGLLRATRDGLRYAGLGLPLAVVSPGSIDHWLRCASAAQVLGREFGAEAILTERELALAEQIEGRPIASAKVGEQPSGAAQLHRPDLAVLAGERVIAVEVELTPKSLRRLEAIIRAWRLADWVTEVRYYCAAGAARRAVERAVARLYASERIGVYEAVPR